MISPQAVDFKFGQYMKEAIKHLWKHQTIYLLPLIFFTALIVGMEFLIPFKTVNRGLQIFIAGFTMFFFMEITFSSTQESYNPKKYLTSIIASWLTFLTYIRNNIFTFMVMFFLAIIFGIFVDIGFLSNSESAKSKEVVDSFSRFVEMVLFKNVSSEFMTIIFCSFGLYSLVDFFVLSRMQGVGVSPSVQTLIKALSINSENWRKIFWFTIGLFLFREIFLIFAPLVVLLFIIAVTFYSMDIFEIDKYKKVRQKEKEKVENLNAVPSFT